MGKDRQGMFYRTFRAYELYLHNCFYYKKIHCAGKQNIPPDGTPVLFVSNHQNCLCDPLAVVFTVRDRKTNFFVRADIFSIHPWITRIFGALAMSPAFRLDFDGKEALWKNRDMFKVIEAKLLEGESVLMYPEGRHQNKHWLGDFSLGYTKLAFETAELGCFQKDIWIVPCCNHYSSYKDIQQEVIMKFGKPISLMPYYDLYREKPRTAQRQLNDAVRTQVCDMMLCISDLKNYKAIDFLRNTFGYKFATMNGYEHDYLPEKLQSDKLFVNILQEMKLLEENQQDAEKAETISIQEIYDDAFKVATDLKKLKIRDEQFDKSPGWTTIILSLLALVGLLPLWVFTLWPNIFIYKMVDWAMRRIKDKMFHNSFLVGISSLVMMPLLYTLTFALTWIFINLWIAIIYSIALPWLGLFAWYYWRFAVKTLQDIRFRRVTKTGSGSKLRELRNNLHERLNKIVK